MNINSDFKDLLRVFAASGVRFLVVGAHAVGYYGRPRATGDFDIWVDPAKDNARRVHDALGIFGAPLENLSAEDLMSGDLIYQMGVAPGRIDIHTGMSGLEFAQAWPKRSQAKIDDLDVAFIGKDDLIINKRASGRARDLADVEMLLLDGEP